MAIVKQGGSDPYKGKVMTTMGYRDSRPMLCYVCGERKDGNFTVNANGQATCPDCAGEKHRLVLTGCDPESCACGKCDDGDASA
jgi:hypothetical protein